MSFEVWLSYNNREETLQLPVTPFFTIETSQGVETMTLHQLSEISLPGLKGLDGMTLESFFPHVGATYGFMQYSPPPDPWECVAMIKRWKESRRPMRVIITETDINVAMLIKSFNYGVADGTKDVKWQLDLLEYVFLPAAVPATARATTSENAVAGSHEGDTEWTIKYGDTLTGIAKAVYGDTSMWKEIYEANRDLITNPDSMANIEGQTIVLPQKSTSSTKVITSETAVANSMKDRTTYTLNSGDTLTGLALAAYGDTSKWEMIWKANKDKIGDNPHSLRGIAGQEIKLPLLNENVAYV